MDIQLISFPKHDLVILFVVNHLFRLNMKLLCVIINLSSVINPFLQFNPTTRWSKIICHPFITLMSCYTSLLFHAYSFSSVAILCCGTKVLQEWVNFKDTDNHLESFRSHTEVTRRCLHPNLMCLVKEVTVFTKKHVFITSVDLMTLREVISVTSANLKFLATTMACKHNNAQI